MSPACHVELGSMSATILASMGGGRAENVSFIGNRYRQSSASLHQPCWPGSFWLCPDGSRPDLCWFDHVRALQAGARCVCYWRQTSCCSKWHGHTMQYLQQQADEPRAIAAASMGRALSSMLHGGGLAISWLIIVGQRLLLAERHNSMDLHGL